MKHFLLLIFLSVLALPLYSQSEAGEDHYIGRSLYDEAAKRVKYFGLGVNQLSYVLPESDAGFFSSGESLCATLRFSTFGRTDRIVYAGFGAYLNISALSDGPSLFGGGVEIGPALNINNLFRLFSVNFMRDWGLKFDLALHFFIELNHSWNYGEQVGSEAFSDAVQIGHSYDFNLGYFFNERKGLLLSVKLRQHSELLAIAPEARVHVKGELRPTVYLGLIFK